MINNYNLDLVYKTIETRILKESSVAAWSYLSENDNTVVEVEFNDCSSILRVVVNPNSLKELQEAIATIDNYFLSKYTRS